MDVPWRPPYRPLNPAQLTAVASAGGLLVVHFWAAWDGPDRRYNSALTTVRECYGGRAVFRCVNVDDPTFVPLIERCRIWNVPMLAGLIAGECVETIVGLRPAAELTGKIDGWLQQAREVIDPRWRTADVMGIARGIAAKRVLDRLPVLADALMDAGCDDERVLAPCRTNRWSPAGEWVVELLLGTG